MVEVTRRVDKGWIESGEERGEGVLDDPHCRYLVAYLERADGPVAVSEVARHVVAEITDSDPGSVSSDVQRRVQTWLHHGQLPALDDAGVVEFDPESGTVALGVTPQSV